MEIKPDLSDWETMKKTAEDIIRGSKRDWIVWTNILKEVECQIQGIEKEQSKKED